MATMISGVAGERIEGSAWLTGARSDYDLVRRAIAFLSTERQHQPGLDRLAAHLGVSPAHAQRTFKRWCGLSPKEFVQALTVEHARHLLAGAESVLATAHEVGLSGPGRLHDLIVTADAMTPGEARRRGAGLVMAYGFHPSPFGDALVVATARGVAGLGFVDEDRGQTRADALADMQARWPAAELVERPTETAEHVERIFGPPSEGGDRQLRLVLIGTDFEVRVWQTLLHIPVGRAVSYADIARHLGRPTAARAVGSAVGRNPISFVVPCHRVLRADGGLGGYHWGLTRKRALIGWEKARLMRSPAGERAGATRTAAVFTP